jgi:TATA-box binding protein (TBP) (component of TFIID and TFIIIB)
MFKHLNLYKIHINYLNIYINKIKRMIKIDDYCCFDAKKLKDNMNVATITLHGKINNMVIYFNNIFDFIVPSDENICYMEFQGKVKKAHNTIITKTRNKKKSTFQNSMSMYVVGNKRLHINLFRNGTLHITGAKSMEDVESTINNLFMRLISENHMYHYYEGDLKLEYLKINMINVNSSLDYKINKEKFKEILLEKNVECVFNKTQNISIKFYNKNKSITIIMHMTSIIISRCTTEDDIITSYEYITNLLNDVKNRICYISIKDILDENKNLKKYIE